MHARGKPRPDRVQLRRRSTAMDSMGERVPPAEVEPEAEETEGGHGARGAPA